MVGRGFKLKNKLSRKAREMWARPCISLEK